MHRIRATIVAALLLVGLWTAAAQAQSQPVSLDEYRAILADALAVIAQGRTPDARTISLPPVYLPGGGQVEPAPLIHDEDDPSVAGERLTAAIEQLDLSVNDNQAVRLAQLEAVSARLDLLQPSLWERFLRWLTDWIDRLLPDRSPIAGGAVGQGALNLVGWLGAIGAALLLALLLSFWLRRLLAGMLSGTDATSGQAGADALPTSSAQAREQATQLAQAGSYREAVRRLYLSALLRLAERELIRYDPSHTNREVLSRVENSPSTRAHLEPVVETFDRVWYGEREPDAETFNAYSREIDALLHETPEARP